MGNRGSRGLSIAVCSILAVVLALLASGLAPAGLQAAEPGESEPVSPADDAWLPPEPTVDTLGGADARGAGGTVARSDTLGLMGGYSRKDGFFLSDEGQKRFLLRIGAHLQLRYTYAERDQRQDGPEASDIDRSDIELERARVYFKGHVLDPNLTYLIQVDADTDGGGELHLLDAYVLYKAGEIFTDSPEAIEFGMGQWKPYFLRQEATSSSKQQMVERSLATEFFNVDRNLGVWVQGAVKPFFYSFAVTNGFDSLNVPPSEVDQIPAFLGKLDFSILGNEAGKYEESNVKGSDDPLWVVGVSLGSDRNNGTSEADRQRFKCYQLGLDSIFKLGPFSLQAEYMGRWLDYPVGNTVAGMGGSGDAQYAHGFYVQGGIFIVPGTLEVAGRFSGIWGSGDRDGDGYEVGPGLSWYIAKSHDLKLQTDLVYFSIDEDVPAMTESLDGTDPNFRSSAAGLEAGQRGIMWRVQFQLRF